MGTLPLNAVISGASTVTDTLNVIVSGATLTSPALSNASTYHWKLSPLVKGPPRVYDVPATRNPLMTSAFVVVSWT